MKYGIYLPNFGPFGDARVLAGLAQDAEQAGWDGFFLWDHIAGWNLPMVDPWVALAAIAVSTQRIRIGTTVTPLPRRRPWKVARETVSIDRLSGGRLTLSVGIGGGQAEYGNLGEETGLKERGAMLDEALDVLSGLWSGEVFSHTGRHYQVREALFLPRPLQQPRIPVWVGGFWPHKAPFRRAARWDGAFPLFQVNSTEQELVQLKEAVVFLQEQRQNQPPFDIVVTGATPGENLTQAAALARRYADCGATWWMEILLPFRFGKSWDDEWPFDALRQRILQGPPKTD
jgi:alkanesulfonate monooxygenase SsuD/methylene tetrahydromethanopterin reductase-like flavin-dependent oxidoreductase (luciferase family)